MILILLMTLLMIPMVISMVIPAIIPMIPVDLMLRVVLFSRASLMVVICLAVIRLAVVHLINSETSCSTCCLIIPSTPKCSVSGFFGPSSEQAGLVDLPVKLSHDYVVKV